MSCSCQTQENQYSYGLSSFRRLLDLRDFRFEQKSYDDPFVRQFDTAFAACLRSFTVPSYNIENLTTTHNITEGRLTGLFDQKCDYEMDFRRKKQNLCQLLDRELRKEILPDNIDYSYLETLDSWLKSGLPDNEVEQLYEDRRRLSLAEYYLTYDTSGW